MHTQTYIRWFEELGVKDVPQVGGKTASLGELYGGLRAAGVKVPNGFAVTAQAYRDALTEAGATEILDCLWLLHAHGRSEQVSTGLAKRLGHGQSIKVVEIQHGESWARIAAQWRREAETRRK